MVPEEDEVALVVERDGAPPLEGGVLAEERGKHAADAAAQPRAEVVQDELGLVLGGAAMALVKHVCRVMQRKFREARSVFCLHVSSHPTSFILHPSVHCAPDNACIRCRAYLLRLFHPPHSIICPLHPLPPHTCTHTLMSLPSFRLERRKRAVGPSGRCTTSIALICLRSSLKTTTSVYSRLAANLTIFLSEKPERL